MVQVPTIPHFKGFNMRNLQYEKIVFPKHDTKVRITNQLSVRFFQSVCRGGCVTVVTYYTGLSHIDSHKLDITQLSLSGRCPIVIKICHLLCRLWV